MDKFPFSDLPSRPLTEREIVSIEKMLDMLIHDLFSDPVKRQEALDYSLLTKLKGYIEIADDSLTQPDLADDAKQLKELLEDLLPRVEAYYRRLN